VEDGSLVVGKMVSKGIIDPTKVVRTALQDPASIAELLAMVAEKPKKEAPMPPCRLAGARTTGKSTSGRAGQCSGHFFFRTEAAEHTASAGLDI
jgi:hypothetical protein